MGGKNEQGEGLSVFDCILTILSREKFMPFKEKKKKKRKMSEETRFNS